MEQPGQKPSSTTPYNLGGTSSGWFYCPDGTMSVALDKQGVAHVVFGLLQDSLTTAGGYWDVYAHGIVYWNGKSAPAQAGPNPIHF